MGATPISNPSQGTRGPSRAGFVFREMTDDEMSVSRNHLTTKPASR